MRSGRIDMLSIKSYLIGGVIISVLGLYIWGLHNKLTVVNTNLKIERLRAENLADIIDKERSEAARLNSLLANLETKEAEVRTVEKVITRDIIKYRDRIINRCTLSADWVCLANASALGVSKDCGAIKVPSQG